MMLLVVSVLQLARVVTSQYIETGEAVDYLTQFGYIQTLEDGTKPYVDVSLLNKAVKDFQIFAGLDPTGNLDTETAQLMKTPRCGKEDKVANFVLQGGKWPKKSLTYRILSYPTARGITKLDVDQKIAEAFKMWEEVSALTFKKTTSSSADIKILFSKYDHGDNNPFDGRGGVLAHAYFPRWGGDAHFDDSEKWSVTPYDGTQILNTLTHEFGHSLGLSHSNVKGAIMAPIYKGWDPYLRLGEDDKKGIQALYGPPQIKSTPSTPIERPTNPTIYDRDLCGSKLDAAVQTSDGVSYVFSGDSYWKLTSDGIASGYPRKISSDWPGLPNNIDAAVTWQDRRVTYFFKGEKYWRFTNRSPSSGYPRDISKWSGLPANLDAAFSWGQSKNLYFFKGSQYWKFDIVQQRIGSDYPKSISTWENVPRGVEAAIEWNNGKSYIFKSGNYWRLDDERRAVDRSNGRYPRDAGKWWFGCPGSTINIPLTDGTNQDILKDYDFEP